VLPMLARNVTLWGYGRGSETEFLVLVTRYVHFARELQLLVGANGTIRVTGCDNVAPLIHVLGYQLQGTCGQKNVVLVTANAERAFLTVDSGFPLTRLEESLQKGTPFTYDFPATRVPILSTEKNWTAISVWKLRPGENLLDILLHDQYVDRLYSALSRSDEQTRLALVQSPGLKRLLPYGAVLDFYGSQICIRSGEVVVPAGASAERGWDDLVGADPKSPGEFVTHLLAKDRGWLAAYFDAMARISPAQQVHLAEGARLKHLYEAYRSTASGIPAAAGVFPRNAELLLLLTRIQWEANGEPRVLGNLGVWEDIVARESGSNAIHDWAKHNRHWDSSDRFLEALAASSNVPIDNGPAQIFLKLSAIDRGRPAGKRLSDETVRLLAGKFSEFNYWYLIFAEFPALDDTSVTRFVEVADRIGGISNPALRANALGAFQADIGLWQIFARQGQIPNDGMNTSWQNAVKPFDGISTPVQLFGAARSSLESTLLAATGSANVSQDQIVDLLAGPAQDSPNGRRVHQELARRIRAVLEDQRLVSVDTLFGLYDGLTEMAHGKPGGDNLLQLAGSLREFEMPRPIFTGSEKLDWSPLVYTNRHAELQVRTDLTKVIRSSASPAQLEAERGLLTAFLRDTLVGLNYAYYEPPGAQVLHNNPLFVRSHDFSAASVQGVKQIWSSPELIGIGVTAGGGAYLMGSLADLPYALASTEEDFIAPEKVQALIWKETVPELLVGAVLPRWWGVSPNELHAAALHQRFGEELLKASVTDPKLHEKVMGILSDRMSAGRLERTEQALRHQRSTAVLAPMLLPADTFYLAAEFRKRFPDQASLSGEAGRELEDLSKKDPSATNPERLSRDFGMPHPAMAQSNTCALLSTGLFPVSGGFASRLFGESVQSSNLYWARLADEMGYSPEALNILVPELTRHMIANIFATNVDDWPAILRAMEETGGEFRQGGITVQGAGVIARQ
jgi:hypothetical protein